MGPIFKIMYTVTLLGTYIRTEKSVECIILLLCPVMERVLLQPCRGPSHRVSRIYPCTTTGNTFSLWWNRIYIYIYITVIRYRYSGMCIHIIYIYICCIQVCHLLASPVRLCCCHVNIGFELAHKIITERINVIIYKVNIAK